MIRPVRAREAEATRVGLSFELRSMQTRGSFSIGVASLIATGFLLSACHTAEHAARTTEHVGEKVVHGTGHVVHKVGTGVAHVGEKIERHTD